MFVYNVYTFCTDDPLNGQIDLSSHRSIWLWRLFSMFIDCRLYAGNQCHSVLSGKWFNQVCMENHTLKSKL